VAYTGAKSRMIIGIESAFGSAGTLKYKIPFKSESINYKIEPIKSEALLGIRGTKALAPGKEGVEGSFELEVFPKIAGVLFYLALGKKEAVDPDGTANSGDEYTKITPVGLGESLPSFTILVDHSGEKFYYLGCKINSLKFSGAVGSIPTLSVDIVGKEEVSGSLDESFVVDPGDEPFYFKELRLYTDEFVTATDLYSSIELNINNNLDTDDYRPDGSGKRKTIDEGQLEVTGSIDIIFDSSVISGEYSRFKNFEDGALGIKLEKSSGDKLLIYLPRVRFSEMTHDIGGPEKIMLKANLTALIPSSGSIAEVRDYVVKDANY